jgi:predicted transcriptional regulator
MNKSVDELLALPKNNLEPADFLPQFGFHESNLKYVFCWALEKVGLKSYGTQVSLPIYPQAPQLSGPKGKRKSIPEDRVLIEACRRNAFHGKQLTREEKRALAASLYDKMTQEEIAKILAVDRTTVSKWLKEKEEIKRKEQERQIMELFLQCYTQDEIADKIGLSQSRISEIIGNVLCEIIGNVS